jgi:hypothetical protein
LRTKNRLQGDGNACSKPYPAAQENQKKGGANHPGFHMEAEILTWIRLCLLGGWLIHSKRISTPFISSPERQRPRVLGEPQSTGGAPEYWGSPRVLGEPQSTGEPRVLGSPEYWGSPRVLGSPEYWVTQSTEPQGYCEAQSKKGLSVTQCLRGVELPGQLHCP